MLADTDVLLVQARKGVALAVRHALALQGPFLQFYVALAYLMRGELAAARVEPRDEPRSRALVRLHRQRRDAASVELACGWDLDALATAGTSTPSRAMDGYRKALAACRAAARRA